MNEKAVFFSRVVFFPDLEKRMNEWHVNFSAEKKNKKTHKNEGEKTQHIFIKKIGGSSKSEWMADELFRGKKKYILLFFSDQKYGFGKNKHDFLIWINEWPMNLSA